MARGLVSRAMIVGFVGSGSMAAAMARGWAGESSAMLFSDSGSGRAAALAEELGGEAASNEEIAARADLVVARGEAGEAGAAAAPSWARAEEVVSILAATPLARLRAALPGGRGAAGDAERRRRGPPGRALRRRRGDRRRCGRSWTLLGHVVELPDEEFDEATAVMGCAPAYLALAVEAIADAGAADGLDPELARELVVETTAGTAELLRIRHPADVRKAVASPGGSTEAGLEALDREGARGGLRGGGRGLAGEDAADDPARAQPRRRRRLRQRALHRLHRS